MAGEIENKVKTKSNKDGDKSSSSKPKLSDPSPKSLKNDIKDLDCNHVETDLSRNLKDVLDSTSDLFCARNHASETVKTIHEKAKKIFVAPGEKGKATSLRNM